MNPEDLNCTLMFRDLINYVNLRDFAIICNELTPRTWDRLIDKNRVHKMFCERTNSTPIILAWSNTIERLRTTRPWFTMVIHGTPIIYPRCFGMTTNEIHRKYRNNYSIDDIYWTRYHKRGERKYFEFGPSDNFSQIRVNYNYFIELFFADLI